jgi:cysteine-rich repeat protein
MKKLAGWVGLQALLVAMGAAHAGALTATSADDICAPTTDPCVITASWDVTGPLDFGLRTVRITGGGRLKGQPDVVLTCGALECDSGLTANPIIDAVGGDNGSVTINAMRACSGDGSTRCFDDAACTGVGLGTCSVGNTGTVAFDGKISGYGSDPGAGRVRAAGDITLGQLFDFSSSAAGYDGGYIDVQSYMGSVIADGPLKARSGVGTYDYSQGQGGFLEVRAAVDVDLSGGLDVWGGIGGGQAEIDAGRDIIVTSNLSSNAGDGAYANGGYITLTAGRDLVVQQDPGGPSPQVIDTTGGGAFYFYGYGNEGSWASGYGGYQYLGAGDDLTLAATAQLRSNGGPGARGGYITLYGDTVTVMGDVHAEGSPPVQGGDSGNAGGIIEVWGLDGITLAGDAVLRTASPVNGGWVNIQSDGLVVIDGEIDVRGGGDSLYEWYQSGEFTFGGMADVVIGGQVRTGTGDDGFNSTIDVCRLTLTNTGIIDHSHGSPNLRNGDTVITVHESMRAEPGSKLLADPAGGQNVIVYRDPYKPPLLEGTASPSPVLAVNPSLVGCPVCSNFEIDQGESCDDGNTTSGDGCRADCQDEGCLAASPGFPSIPLCDDGDACTADRCDPVAHACQNLLSCEEGVACTVDTCVAGTCNHAPEDTLCDDGNDCTDDLCNATTGCVYADLTGGSCEDGDYCTVAGTCDDGDCIVTDVSLMVDNRIKVSLKAGDANDVLKAIVTLPLAEFSANPTVTGVRIVLVDAADETAYEGDLAAALWLDKSGAGQAFSYRAEQAGVAIAAKIKRNPSKGVARAVVKVGGSEMPGAAGQDRLSLSLLFGADPAVDQCLTARSVPCTPKATSTTCRD